MVAQTVTDAVLVRALEEDMHYMDLSSVAVFAPEQGMQGHLLAKQAGVLCGLDLFCRVFALLGAAPQWDVRVREGEAFAAGDVLLRFAGPARVLLQGERTALNVLQHLSGIATCTRAIATAIAGTRAHVTDTRKTLPGLRALQKYAVLCGGGKNHRFNLSDGVMLKENHIAAAGGIAQATARVRTKLGHMQKLEIETRNLHEVQEAFVVGADVIMLDNMPVEAMRTAVEWVRAQPNGERVLLEASGNITLQTARHVAETGVDILSVGALTHSVQACDISMLLHVEEM